MTRDQQVAQDRRYDDWRAAYREDIVERVKHWGDKRKSPRSRQSSTVSTLDTSLFTPSRGD